MLKDAVEIIRQAEVFIITAGAGMGVDSGLPDFRGDAGFWKAYPAYARLGLTFVDAANPENFQEDPAFGWGFYGHRTNLYRNTIPHDGFHLIQNWIRHNSADYFVITSNVDGQFQKAGFDENHILEVHGSIHYLQCLKPCTHKIWANNEVIDVDYTKMRALNIPTCPYCRGVSRPNILMFGDWSWLSSRTRDQEKRLEIFLCNNTDKHIAVIELGAGTAIPTIRIKSENIGWRYENASVIRINPREAEINTPHVSIPYGALEGLTRINKLLGN